MLDLAAGGEPQQPIDLIQLLRVQIITKVVLMFLAGRRELFADILDNILEHVREDIEVLACVVHRLGLAKKKDRGD